MNEIKKEIMDKMLYAAKDYIRLGTKNLDFDELVHYFDDDYGCELYETFEADSNSLWVKTGCSKIVMDIFDDEYVIKIPMMGKAYIDEDEEFHLEYYYDCAQCEDGEDWDYCEKEVEVYEKACEAGLEEFFAGTWYLGEYENHPLYMSRKIVKDLCGSRCKPSDASVEIAKNRRHHSIIPATSLAIWLDEGYSMSLLNKLLDFLDDNGIEDFHAGNLGFDEDGHLRLIDYSSFEE